MRNHTTPLFRQLASAGAKTPTVTPGSGVQGVTFNLAGLNPVTDGKRNYLLNAGVRFLTTFDPDAAGSAVSWDKLYKGVDSFRMGSQLLGEYYQTAHTRGSVLGHVYQVVSGNYCYPQPARAQIPTNTDSDVTLDLYYVLPFAQEFLAKPHETAPFLGWFEQGELEVRVAASDVYNGDYAGAVTKATTSVRAWLEYVPSPDNFIAVPFQWREYTVPGSSTEFTLRGVGGSSGLKGIAGDVAGLAFLGLLTDATGIGLSGPDGADNITRVDIPWRDQQSIDLLDPWFLALRRAVGKRVGPVAGLGTTIVHDGSGWPYTMDGTPNNSLSDSTAYVIPFVFPGSNFETSKAQRVRGDLTMNLGFTSTPSGTARFVTLEFLNWDVPQLEQLTAGMGIDPRAVAVSRKAYNQGGSEKALKFTRIMLG